MTPQGAIDLFREQAHDATTPSPLWSDAVLIGHLNEARQEAARRSRLLEDMTTSEICKITVKADQPTYPVDQRVIFVRRVKLLSQTRPLPKLDLRDADECFPGWETAESTEPRAWMAYGDHKIRLVNPPDVDDTLSLIVVREPLEDLAIDSGDDEDIPARVYPKLIDWMMFRAYLARDLIEKYRPEESRERLAMFEAEFGPASTIRDEKWIHRRHGFDESEGLY